MKKQNIKKMMSIGLIGAFASGVAIASSDDLEEKEKEDSRFKGWLHTPGYVPPPAERTQPSVAVVEEEGPLLYDPVRKMYYRIKRGSNGSVASGSSVEALEGKKIKKGATAPFSYPKNR